MENNYHFSDNFLRMVISSKQTEQVTEQVKNLLPVMDKEYSISELMELLNLSDSGYFRASILQKAIDTGLVELTIPDKPTSSKQKYRLSRKGKKIKEKRNSHNSNSNKHSPTYLPRKDLYV